MKLWFYFKYLQTYLIIKRKQVLDKLGYQKGKTYTPFIILCEPRTGSTLLHTYLNSHGAIVSYGEILRTNLEQPKGKQVTDIIEDVVFADHTQFIKAVGLKIFYDYHDDKIYSKYFRQVVEHEEVKVIHLTRKDLLKLYASLTIARQTQVWSTATSQQAPRNIHIDISHYKQFLSHHFEKRNKIESLFKNHRVLSITYEDLIKDPTSTLAKVQDFLAVDKRKLFSLLKKQTPDSVEKIISNYEEVKHI